MPKQKSKPRIRKSRNVTMDPGIVADLRRYGETRIPPETNLSRLLDLAGSQLVEYGERRRPK